MNGFLLGKIQGQDVPCRFCGGRDSDGHLFWDCTFPPLVEIREHPEFHDHMEMDKTFWPRCLLWHGWLPLLSGVNGGSPWALSLAEGTSHLLECSLGRYSSSQLSEWRLPAGFDVEGASRRVAEEPDVWTDGSLVDHRMSGCFTYRVSRLWACWNWGLWDDDVGDGFVVSACRGFCSVPGPLQTVQRAELWGVILALQANDGVHLGVVWVVCPMWSCSFCLKFGRVRGLSWRRLFLGTAGLVAQFQCRLFLLVQALIFGVPVGLLVHYFGVFGTSVRTSAICSL